MPKVDIILLTHGLPKTTQACLSSIKEAGGDYRIIWIDNGSVLPEREGVEYFLASQKIPHLAVRLGKNVGFLRAFNAGLTLSRAPFVAALNNDTEVPRGWIERLIETAGRKDAGIVGVIEEGACEKGSQQPAVMHEAFRQRYDNGDVVEAKMVSLFCAMIPRRTLQKVGLLSAAYEPGFLDDDDYCERIRSAGLKCLVDMSVHVKHKRRSTWRTIKSEEEIQKMIMERREQFKQQPVSQGGWACVRGD